MSLIIDARREGGDLVILGKSITVPSNSDAVGSPPPLLGSIRFNPTNQAIEVFHEVGSIYKWEALLFESQESVGGVVYIDAIGQNGLTATGGPITTSGTITLALTNTGVVPATYVNPTITVDATGRITLASNGTLGVSRFGASEGSDSGMVFGAGTPGTVTSVGITNTDGEISVTNSPITTSGTITVGLSTTTVIPGHYVNANITVDANGRITSASDGLGASLESIGITGSEFIITGSPVTTSGNIDIELAPTGVTAGIYTNPTITVDNKGRITSIAPGLVDEGFSSPMLYGYGKAGVSTTAAFAAMAADTNASMICMDESMIYAAYGVNTDTITFGAGVYVFGKILTTIAANVNLTLPTGPGTCTIFENTTFSNNFTSVGDNLVLRNCGLNSVVITGSNILLQNCWITGNLTVNAHGFTKLVDTVASTINVVGTGNPYVVISNCNNNSNTNITTSGCIVNFDTIPISS